MKFWKEFTEKLRAEHKMLGATALSQLPELRNEVELHLRVGSLAMQEEIEKIKPDLLLYLRQKLDNRRLSLSVTLDESSAGRPLYTNREKLEYLMEKYPKLADLKDRLDLEADF